MIRRQIKSRRPFKADRSPDTASSPSHRCTYAIAAEQKARLTYDNILRLSDDPDVNNVIRFLREREIVHFQRFGECLRLCKEKMDAKNVYLTNPAFDKQAVSQPQPQPRNMANG